MKIFNCNSINKEFCIGIQIALKLFLFLSIFWNYFPDNLHSDFLYLVFFTVFIIYSLMPQTKNDLVIIKTALPYLLILQGIVILVFPVLLTAFSTTSPAYGPSGANLLQMIILTSLTIITILSGMPFSVLLYKNSTLSPIENQLLKLLLAGIGTGLIIIVILWSQPIIFVLITFFIFEYLVAYRFLSNRSLTISVIICVIILIGFSPCNRLLDNWYLKYFYNRQQIAQITHVNHSIANKYQLVELVNGDIHIIKDSKYLNSLTSIKLDHYLISRFPAKISKPTSICQINHSLLPQTLVSDYKITMLADPSFLIEILNDYNNIRIIPEFKLIRYNQRLFTHTSAEQYDLVSANLASAYSIKESAPTEFLSNLCSLVDDRGILSVKLSNFTRLNNTMLISINKLVMKFSNYFIIQHASGLFFYGSNSFYKDFEEYMVRWWLPDEVENPVRIIVKPEIDLLLTNKGF